MNIKRIVGVSLLIALAFNFTGCGTLRKKFIRKKKKVEKKPFYLQIREYDIKPSIELYRKHYVYWRSWHRELMEVLGENKKKDIRCIQEIIGNLQDMQKNLIPEKQAGLQEHIDEMAKVENMIKRGNLTVSTKSRIMSTLEKESRSIKRDFTYRKMGPYIAGDFEYKEELGPPVEDEAVEIDDSWEKY